MTDNEVIKKMTSSLRALDKVLKKMTETKEERAPQGPLDKLCPFCNLAYSFLERDIEDLNDIREDLIEASKHPDRDEKLVMAASVETLAIETDKRYWVITAFLDISHDVTSGIIDRIGNDGSFVVTDEMKKAFIEMMEHSGEPPHPSHNFDPKKAN